MKYCAEMISRSVNVVLAKLRALLMADRKCVSPPHFAISRNGEERVGLRRVYPFCARYRCAASLINIHA